MLAMIDMATGLSIEPPMAWIMRNTTSVVRLGARLDRRDPATKVRRPTMKVLRRPSRSAVEPESMRRLASTRV